MATPIMMNPLVTLHNISVDIAGKHILREITLQVLQGQILTIIGPNGAGKTTLLRVLLGLEPYTTGALWRKPHLCIGYTPQRLNLNPLLPLSVCDFLKTASLRSIAIQRMSAILSSVGLPHACLQKEVTTLSGGQLQRVLLARALLRNPDLLVLDEPVQGVDLMGQNELYRLITNIRDTHNCSVLLVSHDLHVVMASADEVICLNTHICCSGKPSVVQHDPAFLALYTHNHQHHHDLQGGIHEHP